MSVSKTVENLSLVARYLVLLARYHLVLPWYDAGATKRLASKVLEYDFQRGSGRKLEAVSIHTVFPELSARSWTMVGMGSWNPEVPFLCGALKAINATRVLEIGTYEGAMTLQLACNIPADGRVYTLDVGPADVATAGRDISDSDRRLAEKPRERIGRRFRDTPYAGRITQIIRDSATVDYSDHFDWIDLAYIDGGHSYAQVKIDTERVMPLVRAGGVIFWHDYQPGCVGVTRYLHELAGDYPVKNIRRTQLAVLRL